MHKQIYRHVVTHDTRFVRRDITAEGEIVALAGTVTLTDAFEAGDGVSFFRSKEVAEALAEKFFYLTGKQARVQKIEIGARTVVAA